MTKQEINKQITVSGLTAVIMSIGGALLGAPAIFYTVVLIMFISDMSWTYKTRKWTKN